MDYQETIEALSLEGLSLGGPCRRMTKFCKALEVAVSTMQELEEYKQIGTLEECREAVRRQTPRKQSYEGDGYAPDGTFAWDTWICPNCESKFEVEFDDYDYCPNCGQRILWE